MLRKILFMMLAVSGMATNVAQAETSYDEIAVKASRFFEHKEWASASAMYSLLIDGQRVSPDVFGHAIVSAGMRDAGGEQNMLVRQALEAHLPIDSVFGATRVAAFEAGNAPLYEKFLIATKEREPWLTRTVDAYLLDYYLFRDDGPGIVRLSQTMLDGLPGNEGFMYKLARGQVICGDVEDAVATYRAIVDNNPVAYDALLYLGNYYAMKGNEAQAAEYLSRAYEIRPTPYVERMLKRLSPCVAGSDGK